MKGAAVKCVGLDRKAADGTGSGEGDSFSSEGEKEGWSEGCRQCSQVSAIGARAAYDSEMQDRTYFATWQDLHKCQRGLGHGAQQHGRRRVTHEVGKRNIDMLLALAISYTLFTRKHPSNLIIS